MNNHVADTDKIIECLKREMLDQFCLQWPQFMKVADRVGDNSILSQYAEEMAGRGWKASQIRTAVQRAKDSMSFYPTPKQFRELVEGKSLNRSDAYKPKTKWTEEDNARAKQNLEKLRELSGDACAMHKNLRINFSQYTNPKTAYRAQVERVAMALIGRD